METIDKFIEALNSKAKLEKERAFCDAVKWNRITEYGAYCRKLESEYRQLAEWLKDYKRLLEQEPCVIKMREATQKEKDSVEEYIKNNSVTIVPTYEPCEDAISRQAALNCAVTIDGGEYRENGTYVDIDDIKALPSITPTEKMGRWVRTISENGVTSAVRCSRCGFEDNRYELFNYCPKCGCKMQKVEK